MAKPPPNLTPEDARVQLSWPAYNSLKRRPPWKWVLVGGGSLSLLCFACGVVQGLILH